MDRDAELNQRYEPQIQLLKVLAHPARLAILSILRNGEECVCHMEASLGYRQAYLSQQLAVLRNAGIVEDRRDGWNIFYRVVRPEIFLVVDAVVVVSGSSEQLMRIQRTLGEECPCPKCSAERAEMLESPL